MDIRAIATKAGVYYAVSKVYEKHGMLEDAKRTMELHDLMMALAKLGTSLGYSVNVPVEEPVVVDSKTAAMQRAAERWGLPIVDVRMSDMEDL